MKIGNRSYLAKPLYIVGYNKIKIGKRVRILPNIRIECHGNGKVIVGDNTSIGPNVSFISKDLDLIIGENTTISSNVFITNSSHGYYEIDVHIMDQPSINKKYTCRF